MMFCKVFFEREKDSWFFRFPFADFPIWRAPSDPYDKDLDISFVWGLTHLSVFTAIQTSFAAIGWHRQQLTADVDNCACLNQWKYNVSYAGPMMM